MSDHKNLLENGIANSLEHLDVTMFPRGVLPLDDNCVEDGDENQVTTWE